MRTLAIFFTFIVLSSFSKHNRSPIHNVYFPHDSAQLSGTNAQLVKDVYAKTPQGQSVRFGIMGGFTSSLDMYQRNRLSIDRAKSIVNLLEGLGADTEQINVTDRYKEYGWPIGDGQGEHELALQVEVLKGRPWAAPVITSLDKYLPLPVQHFTIDPRKLQTITGEQGTVITIPAKTLCCSDGTVPASMEVELTEVYGRNQLVNANLHTTSNGKVLESGGTVLMEAFCNKRPAKVASGKELELSFPLKDEPQDGMETFIGVTDQAGNFDWTRQRSGSFGGTSVRESYFINDRKVSKEEYLATKARYTELQQVRENEQAEEANSSALDAYLLKSGSLGWINCDKFYDATATTEFVVQVDTTLRPSVRMVFDNINSVLAGNYDARTGKVRFSGVPVGEPVRLVGYSIVNDTPYMNAVGTVIKANGSHTLQLQQTTKQGMEQQLASLR